MKRLIEIGFVRVGEWHLEQEAPVFALRSMDDATKVLVAFACAGEVMYVGRTYQPLARRLSGLQQPDSAEGADSAVHRHIVDSLYEGVEVDIYLLPDRGLLKLGEFQVDLAAGLEESIIATLQPPWNTQDAAQRTISLDSTNVIQGASVRAQAIQPMASHALDERAEPPRFEFLVGAMQTNNGVFDVPAVFSDYLAGDGKQIEIRIGDRPVLTGYINRRANVNRSPRIMGGDALMDWFRQQKAGDAPIQVEIQSPTAIQLRPTT